MPGPDAPDQNHPLAALPPSERERIHPHLELIPMPLGKVLYESGDPLRLGHHSLEQPTECPVRAVAGATVRGRTERTR